MDCLSHASYTILCKRRREKNRHSEDGRVGARVLWETGGGIGETRQGDGSSHVLLDVQQNLRRLAFYIAVRADMTHPFDAAK